VDGDRQLQHDQGPVWRGAAREVGTARGKGASIVDVKVEPELEYARHCREADIRTAAFLDCLSYYNGEGNAEPGSLAYYGGPETWRAL
jgi:hypothetical protein